ncbi:hypothetical protein [Hydrogenobacter hydrogenophilus]|uniref:Uncharacterized protein n=1 Tax=Hydrogenobacter hydrogenophilus TaxID=35835 RepID=A0A285PA49_9AQUI|nr:hypothetical protein [Hydrogenobacter hydrogenophilus]SNZ16741.1 hypothetical protein SAMN06265353_1694 [Hydrogenobacter hydrogenophilus]
MMVLLFLLMFGFVFAQSQCECADYVLALNQLNETLKDFKIHLLGLGIGLATVMGLLASVIVGNALRRSGEK